TGSGSGVWIRVRPVEGRPVMEGDVVWLGSQMLIVNKTDGQWTVAHHDHNGAYRAAHPIGEKGILVGRALPISLDTSDMSLSKRHAQLRVDGGRLTVFDLGSTNGTYVKL